MPYQENIPQPTDIISTSQNDILVNFQTIHTAWDINHVPFDAVGQGKHNQVSLPIQAVDPAAVAAEMQVYTKTSTLSLLPEMFIRRAAGAVVEFTSSLNAVTGWTRLPSGILLKWGTGNANGSTQTVFPVGATIPVFAAIYNVQLTVADAGAADSDSFARITAVAPASFFAYGSRRTVVATQNVAFYYLAIGI